MAAPLLECPKKILDGFFFRPEIAPAVRRILAESGACSAERYGKVGVRVITKHRFVKSTLAMYRVVAI